MSKDNFVKSIEGAMDVIRETAVEAARDEWDEMECQCEVCQTTAEQAAIMTATMAYISTEMKACDMPHLAEIVDRMLEGFADASREDTIGLTRAIGHFQSCIESIRMEITARTARAALGSAFNDVVGSAVHLACAADPPGESDDGGTKYQH